MLYNQFISRLILCLISGLLFIGAFKHLAISNPVKELPDKNNYKWIGIVFNVLCVINLIAFVCFLFQIDYPTITEEPFIPRDGIVRRSDVHIVWGYANIFQNSALTFFIGIFACYGFAQYFLKFKPSPSKWWSKILKLLGYVLVWMFYVNSTDFHYFDTPEWIKTGLYLFVICVCFAPSSKPKVQKHENDEDAAPLETAENTIAKAEVDVIDQKVQQPIVEPIIEEVIKEDTTPQTVILAPKLDETIEPKICPEIRYCRYCGKQIEVDSKFCKYCGKPTGENGVNAKILVSSSLNYFAGLKQRFSFPKFKLAKSGPKKLKIIMPLKFVIPICALLGIVGITLCTIYASRSWIFSSFFSSRIHGLNGSFIGFFIAIIGLGLLTWILIRWQNKSQFNFLRPFILSFGILTYIASLGIVVTSIVGLCKFDSYYHEIKLDKALLNPNDILHSESVDDFLKIVSNWPDFHLPDDYLNILRNEANKGNADAQDILGCYYFDRERINSEYNGVEPDHERAIYWFKKAADNGNLNAKVNMARFYMGKLPGLYQDIDLAEKYLKETIYGPEVIRAPGNAYYYLGLIYAERDFNKARALWQEGAKLGDEDCIRCVESYTVPNEAIHYYYEYAVEDSTAQY